MRPHSFHEYHEHVAEREREHRDPSSVDRYGTRDKDVRGKDTRRPVLKTKKKNT